jgi:hypothetical protein
VTVSPQLPVELLPFIEAVETRLKGGLPTTSPPTKGYLSEPVDVPRLGGSGHVQRYWVLHPFAGTSVTDQDFAGISVDIDWTFQLTLAAGYSRDVYALVDLVRSLFHRWAPEVEGYVCGELRPPPGFDPGPVRLDRDVEPYRPYLPLQFRTTITR